MPHFKLTARPANDHNPRNIELSTPSGTSAAVVDIDGQVSFRKSNWSEGEFIELAAIVKHRSLFYDALTNNQQRTTNNEG